MQSVASSKAPGLTVQAFWLMVAKTIGFGLSVVLPMVLVRVMNQAEYGLYKQAFLIVVTASSLLSFGVGISAFYFLPREKERRPQIALNIVTFNAAMGLGALLVLSFHPGLLSRLLGSPQMSAYARLVGCVIFLMIFSSFLELIATALQDVKHSTFFIVFAQFSKAVFMTVAAVWLHSVQALLYAAVLQGLLQSGVLLWYLYRQFGRFWLSFDWRFFRQQLGYAAPFGLTGALYTVQTDLHNYFISNKFSTAEFAIYAVGCVQIPLIGLLRDSISAVLISKTSELQHRGDARGILLLTASAMRKTALIYLPVYALLMVVGREFIVFLYTRTYEASWPIFAVNLSLLPFAVVITDPIIRSYAEYRYFIVWVRVILLGALILALWLGIRWFGMIGAVGALVVITIIERVTLSWRTASIVGMRIEDLRLFVGVFQVAALSAASAAGTFFVRMALGQARPFTVLAICGITFAVLFVLCVVLLGWLAPDDGSSSSN